MGRVGFRWSFLAVTIEAKPVIDPVRQLAEEETVVAQQVEQHPFSLAAWEHPPGFSGLALVHVSSLVVVWRSIAAAFRVAARASEQALIAIVSSTPRRDRGVVLGG
jgi:hypothetical protein